MKTYTRRAKLSFVAFGLVALPAQLVLLFAGVLAMNKGALLALWFGATVVYVVLFALAWRWLVRFLARRYGPMCPNCQQYLLGKSPEETLKETGRCCFCGSQVLSDVTPAA